jgi:hypothetical protein
VGVDPLEEQGGARLRMLQRHGVTRAPRRRAAGRRGCRAPGAVRSRRATSRRARHGGRAWERRRGGAIRCARSRRPRAAAIRPSRAAPGAARSTACTRRPARGARRGSAPRTAPRPATRGGGARCPTGRRPPRRTPRTGPAVPSEGPRRTADEDEALDALGHPDGELERDRRAHRQPDDVGVSQPRSSSTRAASAASIAIETGAGHGAERPAPRWSYATMRTRGRYRSATGSNTADEIVHPVISRTGSPLPRSLTNRRGRLRVLKARAPGARAPRRSRDRPCGWPSARCGFR